MNGLIGRHEAVLPESVRAHRITLGEGSTPLVRLDNIMRSHGLAFDLYCKFEGCNPTGSFKDRGMVTAIAHAVSQDSKAVVCASTGNTSASAAAYSAKADMKCLVLMPEGKVASGKISQAVMHGAFIVEVEGNFDDAMRLVAELGREMPIEIVNSTNPMRLQGQKTLAFEVIDDLGRAPDYHALPVGNAGNISAHWIGYSEAAGTSTAACTLCNGKNCRFKTSRPAAQSRPTLLGYQAERASPFVKGEFEPNPETVASAIRIGRPQSWQQAKTACSESGGRFSAVSDSEILKAQRILASTEGIFCEPASAASIAGVLADANAGRFEKGATVVCTVTGHGLKDPSVAEAHLKTTTVRPDLAELRKVIEEQA